MSWYWKLCNFYNIKYASLECTFVLRFLYLIEHGTDFNDALILINYQISLFSYREKRERKKHKCLYHPRIQSKGLNSLKCIRCSNFLGNFPSERKREAYHIGIYQRQRTFLQASIDFELQQTVSINSGGENTRRCISGAFSTEVQLTSRGKATVKSGRYISIDRRDRRGDRVRFDFRYAGQKPRDCGCNIDDVSHEIAG